MSAITALINHGGIIASCNMVPLTDSGTAAAGTGTMATGCVGAPSDGRRQLRRRKLRRPGPLGDEDLELMGLRWAFPEALVRDHVELGEVRGAGLNDQRLGREA